MARRTTPTKGRTSKRDTAPEQTSEQAPEKAKRRGRGAAKLAELPVPAMSAPEHVETESSPVPEMNSVEAPEQLEMDASAGSTPSASPRQKRRGRQEKVDEPAPASEEAEAASPSPHPSAARWDPETGTATFDWPSIEQVAATHGPNQAMAKLLLAARAEGANSRWPF